MTRVAWLVALLGCGAPVVAEVAESPPDRVAAIADVQHYELAVAVDLERAAVSGTVDIEVDVRDGDVLVLDARGIEVERVEVDGHAAEHLHARDDLHVVLPRGDARRRVKIAYLGYGSRGLRAARGGIHTHHHTEDWMPCRMDPSDRATIAMALEVRDELVVAAVGEPDGVEKSAAGREVHRFRLAHAYPAYVMGFAVGKFQERTYVEGQIAYRDLSLVHDEEEMARIFADVPRMVAFFEERSGVRYPLPRFEQVIATGWVGMEHAGFSVVGAEWARTALADPKEDWLAAHELAHQWWGNWITCASWEDFWLNEAFAVFMVAAWKERRWGREHYDRRIQLARERWERLRRLDREHPLALAGDSWRWPGPGGDTLPYTKGPVVLGYLRYVLGEEAFWEGVRRYSQRHAGGSATTQDLERAMNAPEGFFEQWVWGSGAPSVRASGQVRNGAFELRLVQQGDPWRLRVPVRVVDDRGERDIDVDIRARHHRIRIPIEGTLQDVQIDPHGVLPVAIEISAGR